MLLGAVLIGAGPALALEDGASAAQLEEAFAQIRAKVEEQRALTGAAARDAADRLAEIGRLNDRIRELERENGQLREANRTLHGELVAMRGQRDRLEREAQELAKAAEAKLDEFAQARSGIAAARAQLDEMAQALSELAAQRSVITGTAASTPSAGELPALEDPAGLRLELARAQARIEELERQRQ
jgi:predicted nuclease with TOPRIM domain